MHARYYTPEVGRFLSVDPVISSEPAMPQSWNRYTYVRDRPVVYTDPTGREVQVCCAPAEIALGLVDHCWLKTDTTEAGLGCEGVVSCSQGQMPGDEGGKCAMTQISDHSACEYRSPECRTVKGVNENCVNLALTLDATGLGAPQGVFSPLNNCQTFVSQTLDRCSTAPLPWTLP